MKSTPYDEWVGKKINKWKILEIGDIENEARKCICQCECGKIRKHNCCNLIKGKRITQCKECSLKEIKEKNIKKNEVKYIGKKYGKWTIIKINPSKKKGIRCDCKCECGNTRSHELSRIVKGESKQCKSCASAKINIKHGLARSRINGNIRSEYRIYHNIKKRCYKENVKCFQHYGARGITMCERWLESVENFVQDMGDRPSSKHSIDRIDNNKGYSPENCKWSLQKEQVANRRKVGDMQKEIDSLKEKLKSLEKSNLFFNEELEYCKKCST